MQLRHVIPALLLTACQGYDLERTTTMTVRQSTTREVFAGAQLKPNVMLLVDNSCSMALPIDPSDARCSADCGQSTITACPTDCPTRISELKNAMTTFLAAEGTTARFGLTVFPELTVPDGVCTAPRDVSRPLPPPTTDDVGTEATLASWANQVGNVIGSLTPRGGTPTAAALQFVSRLPELNDANDGRADLVLLLTDGLPNCNATNGNQLCDCVGAGCAPARTSTCACTVSNCTSPSMCSSGCLDADDTTLAVRALLAKGIHTAVVGFGADVNTGSAPWVLRSLAVEGGFTRTCPGGTSAECGGSACDVATGRCVGAFFAAQNAPELSKALSDIGKSVVGDACVRTLSEAPAEPGLLSVLVDGTSLPPSDATWKVVGPVVTFQGALCERLKASTAANPVDLEYRVVSWL